MPDDKPKSFFQRANESAFGQLISFAANFTQLGELAAQIVEGIIQLVSGSDTDAILSAIHNLQTQLQIDVVQLGNLILQQAQILKQEIDLQAMATALSHSDAASSDLANFLRTKTQDDLSLANNESTVGVGFFLNQEQTPPNVFFMPGLVKAGTIRLLVTVTQDSNFLTSRPDEADQIRQMTLLLKSMIDLIRQKVDTAHVVTEKSHLVHTSPNPRTIIDGYSHQEADTDSNGFNVFRELQFFPCQGLPVDPLDPAAQKALAQAQDARAKGVADELAFMGIPQLQAVLQSWRTLLVAPNVLRAGSSAA